MEISLRYIAFLACGLLALLATALLPSATLCKLEVWPTKLSFRKASVGDLQDDSSSLCDEHWTWSGISRFWHEKSSKTGHVKWSIQRSGAPAAGGTVTAESSLGVLCSDGSFAPKSAVVVVQSPDRFSSNLWHRMAVVFEAWVVPRVLQLKEKLPGEILISYHVPRLKNITVDTDPGPFPWQLLGPVALKDCGFEHHILAPSDGFLWDLAWDLPLKCVHASNLWRSFQSAARLPSACSFKGACKCFFRRGFVWVFQVNIGGSGTVEACSSTADKTCFPSTGVSVHVVLEL